MIVLHLRHHGRRPDGHRPRCRPGRQGAVSGQPHAQPVDAGQEV